MTLEEHYEWFKCNRHLLSFGHILALGEKLTTEENEELENWYRKNVYSMD